MPKVQLLLLPMNQITLTNIFESLVEEPKSIGDRLSALGYTRTELEEKFSVNLLDTKVYASSFLKFLNENKSKFAWDEKIPAKDLPQNYQNSYGEGNISLAERLAGLNIDVAQAKDMFSEDLLNLSMNSDEFQDFIVSNKDKFVKKLEQLATGGAQNG